MTLVWREKTGLPVGCYANFDIGYTVILRLVVAHCLKSFIFPMYVYEHQGQSRKSEIEIYILNHAGYD
jgi:hypothetical protein